jgi:hypothetical protein
MLATENQEKCCHIFGDGERDQLDGPYSSKSTCQTFGSIKQESGF